MKNASMNISRCKANSSIQITTGRFIRSRLVRKSIVKRMSTCFMMFISADMIKNQKSLYNMLLNAAKIAGHDKAVSLLEALIAKLNQEAGKEATVEEAYANMDSGEIYDRMIDEVTRHLDLYVERKTGKVVHYNEEKELGSIAVGGQPSIFFRQADFIYDEEVRRYERVDFY